MRAMTSTVSTKPMSSNRENRRCATGAARGAMRALSRACGLAGAAIALSLLAGCPESGAASDLSDSFNASEAQVDRTGASGGDSADSSGSGNSGGSPDGGSGATDSSGPGNGSSSDTASSDLDTIPAPKVPTLPTGKLRIVTLGDSVTEGIGDESAAGGGYPRRLLEAVNGTRPGSSLLNLGISGWTSTDLLEGDGTRPNQIDAAVAGDPDVAFLWVGSNDLWQLYEYGPESGTSAELEAQDLARFSANIETLLSRLKGTGAALYVGLLDDQALRPVIEDRATLPNTTFAERAQMSAQVVRYNNVLIAAAQRHSATLVDFYNTTIFTSPDTLDFDGIHPNAAGYDSVTALWFDALSPALR